MNKTPTKVYTHDHILMPLAITVIIDTKIRAQEMAEFHAQAIELFNLFNLPPLSKAEIMKWFKENGETIALNLAGKRRNTTILVALSRFTEDVHVENIYDAMIAISLCDKEYIREESDLVKSAASIWGYNRPPIKIVD